MVKTGRHLWAQHPHVDNDLTVGERAADGMKKWFGTWTALGLIVAVIVYWLLFVFDPGELKLNLGLSFLASVQGVILQIAANRGDKKSAELALATHANGEALLDLNKQQMVILQEMRALRQAVTEHTPDAAKDGE